MDNLIYNYYQREYERGRVLDDFILNYLIYFGYLKKVTLDSHVLKINSIDIEFCQFYRTQSIIDTEYVKLIKKEKDRVVVVLTPEGILRYEDLAVKYHNVKTVKWRSRLYFNILHLKDEILYFLSKSQKSIIKTKKKYIIISIAIAIISSLFFVKNLYELIDWIKKMF